LTVTASSWRETNWKPNSATLSASGWVELDTLLKDKDYQLPIKVLSTPAPTAMTVQFDLADSTGRILKSVVETAQSKSVSFLAPGYGMSLTALTGKVTGLETNSQRSADYLKVAKMNPVAATDRPKHIITDCAALLGGEANNEVLTNLAQTMQALGFNTADAYLFDGLAPAHINSSLNANGLSKRSNAETSNKVGTYNPPTGTQYPGGYFSFDTLAGITHANLTNWANGLVSEVASKNGGSPSQIVSIYMASEVAWCYPLWLDNVNNTVKYLEAFQTYLQEQGATHGFTYTDLAVGATSWSSLHPVGQSVGNPLTGPKSIQDRRLYYWTMRFYSDKAVCGMKMGRDAVTGAVGHVDHPVETPVYLGRSYYRWYWPSPNAHIEPCSDVNADTAVGAMDWASAGRTGSHTLWTQDAFEDRYANAWSVYAAMMRSLTQARTQGFGGDVSGQSMGTMPTGGKYKIFALLGNGAKSYRGYGFGPFSQVNDAWSEKSSALVNPGIASGNVYSEYADANRLIGRSESILYPGKAKRSPVAILLPGASCLWDTQPVNLYYDIELFGLYYAISHGCNITVDIVDDADVVSGALTDKDNDYHVLYVVGPNVSAAAQTAIDKWINTWGTHNRQLVLGAGAGVADEYNCSTATFDSLAGLAGSRAPIRDVFRGNYPIGNYATTAEPYTAKIRVTNKEFYFNAKAMNIRGPFQALSPLSGASGPSWTDQVYTTSVPASQAACVTKRYTGSGVSNFVTAFGFFPGWQYYASPDFSHTNQLPQGWSIMAREIAIMPVIRLNPPRSVHIYNGKGPAGETLTEANQYLSNCPVEALRLNVGSPSPTAIGVVLLNWGGAPFHDLKFKVLDGIASPTRFALASGEALTDKTDSGRINGATMTLHDVDVVLISK
jgi:hypothetical protein